LRSTGCNKQGSSKETGQTQSRLHAESRYTLHDSCIAVVGRRDRHTVQSSTSSGVGAAATAAGACRTSFFGVAVLLGLLKFEFDLSVTWIAVTPAKGW
jgi:hypothetical protein